MSKTACAPCHFARTIYRRHRLQGAANSGADVRTVLEAATLLTQNPAHPNVRNADEPSSTLAASVTAFGVLLFVNAGFSIPTPLESVTEAIYDEMFNLNAKGPFFAVQKLAPMISRGGSVVLTTSIANVKGMPGNAAYGAAKAAVRSFARTLAAELLPREIRVNAVTPGPIDTPIIGKVFTGKDEAAQIREKMIGMIPMKRWGTSEEVAKAVLFLAFDATFTTGAELPVDGGWSQL